MSDEPLDEGERRRKRTRTYLSMWAIEADVSALPVLVDADAEIHEPAAVVGRAKALCLCSLKGQGLTQHEAFAFADAYDVWDHLTLPENDFVLDPEPTQQELVQQAWRSEGLWVLEWSLGLVRHLGFPDHPADSGEAVRICIEQLCASDAAHELRDRKELLDAFDVTNALDAISEVARAQGSAQPSALHPGVVFERRSALGWLVHRRA